MKFRIKVRDKQIVFQAKSSAQAILVARHFGASVIESLK